MFKIFQKIKILFIFGPELEELVKKLKKDKQKALQNARKHNLNLCFDHKQERNHSFYSKQNCDYCRMQNENRKMREVISNVPENT